MRVVVLLLFICVLGTLVFAQKADDVLATATGHSFRLRDLSAETQRDVANLPVAIPKARASLLDQLINQRILTAEAKSRGLSMGKLMADEKAKVANPPEEEITKVIDANQAQLARFTPAEARRQVIAFLRGNPEQKAIGELITQLKGKYKPVMGKDVNATGLQPADVLATVSGQPITAKEFEEYAQYALFEAKAELADILLAELDNLIYDALVKTEAAAQGIDSGALIAREVTNKMKDFTDREREALTDAFADGLFKKYQVKTMYSGPEPPLENVTADDDPSTGPATAPVTVIMFSDFQCSACAATHPLLKEAVAAFPGKVRLVVRDFPLESIHTDAYLAARAAAAANAQGKFIEYIEILYKNRGAQDLASLKKYAAQIGLNAQQFEVDLNSEKTAAEIRKDMADGEALGISSTPTIFVNRRRVRNFSVPGFKAAIEKALSAK